MFLILRTFFKYLISKQVTKLKLSAKDKILYSGSDDGLVKIWVTSSLKPIKTIEIGSPIRDIVSSYNCRTMVVLSNDGEDTINDNEDDDDLNPNIPYNFHIYKVD